MKIQLVLYQGELKNSMEVTTNVWFLNVKLLKG